MSNDHQAPASCCNTSPTSEAPDPEEPVSAGSGCCGAERPSVEPDGRDNLLASGEDTTTCPVMIGSPVSKKTAEAQGLFRDYDGQRYWFCCAGCGPAFDSDPAKYAANVA